MTFRLLLLLALGVSSLGAQLRPSLSAQDGRRNKVPLKIDRFELEVLLFEDLAQTSVTVTFENTTQRSIEGELAIPLPPGATVSGYQLEVNGKMRESTAVDRARARFAYESIKRQNIDPGYIERQPGNVYRTRIFPITRYAKKAVRLTYCHPLSREKDHLEYLLLLPEIPVSQAHVTIKHLQERTLEILAPESGPGSSWSLVSKNGAQQFLARETVTLDNLHLQLAPLKADLLIETPQHSYRRTLDKPSGATPLPKDTQTLNLIWDCSQSGRDRDHASEFAYLDKLFQDHPNLRVNLTRIRLAPEKTETFEITDGDWKNLRETLENVFYDGGTDLAAWQPEKWPSLLFTDGRSFHSRLKENWPHPVTLIDANGLADPYWVDQATLSGGSYLNLTRQTEANASVTRKFSLLPEGPDRKSSPAHPEEAIQIIKSMWASEKLRTMERQFAPDRKAIAAFCKTHRLVSDETSLIVLERFEDHLRYRIPPPEPDLLAKYNEALRRERAEPKAEEVLAKRWKTRTNWHLRDFPWQNHVLDPTLARLAIWKRALFKTFDEDELNPQSLREVEKAVERTKQLNRLKASGEIDNLDAYQAWLTDLKEVTQELNQLESLPYGNLQDGKMPVAVNGFVNSGGKLLAAKDTTLKSALKQAGGISTIGSPTRVSLYRSSRKTTYNLLSKEYTPVLLQAGDLIVVEQARPAPDSWDDPFSADSSSSVDYRNEPPVVIPSRALDFRPSDGSGGDDPFSSSGGGTGNGSPASLFDIPTPNTPGNLDLQGIREALAKNSDFLEVYRRLRPQDHDPEDFFLDLGDFFLAEKKADLARRVLSNLIETPTPRPTAYRKWAYLLAKHGDWAGALDLLNRAARHAPDDLAIVLDQAWVLEKLGKNEASKKRLKTIQETFSPGDPASQAIGEMAAAESRNTGSEENLPLDIRVVVSPASGQSLDLRMTEPSDTITSFTRWSEPSKIGARTLEAVGVAEYSLRQAVPGPYHLSYRTTTPQIVRLQVYRHWGREKQTCEEKVLFLPVTRTRRTLVSFSFELN